MADLTEPETDTTDPEEATTTEEEDIDVVKDLELQVLKESLQGRSANTIKTYTSIYEKLYAALGKEVHQASQKLIISTAEQMSQNANTRAAIINIGILVRRLYRLDVKELEKLRKTNKKTIETHTNKINQSLDLPTLEEFDTHINHLYHTNKFGDFIINYLIRHLCCRNQDLAFDIVTRQRDVPKDNKNYMWLGRQKATLYRRDYKTDKTYGEKINIITDLKIRTALKRLLAKKVTRVVPSDSPIGYHIKKASFNELGEGALFKIIVNDAREKGDLHRLTEISKLRGTDVCTIAASYNVQKLQ